jgi:hypothetical protein
MPQDSFISCHLLAFDQNPKDTKMSHGSLGFLILFLSLSLSLSLSLTFMAMSEGEGFSYKPTDSQ